MSENGRVDSATATASWNGKTAQSMRGSGALVALTVKVLSLILRVKFIQENGETTKLMGKVPTHTQTAQSTKEIGFKTCSMVSEKNAGLMVQSL